MFFLVIPTSSSIYTSTIYLFLLVIKFTYNLYNNIYVRIQTQRIKKLVKYLSMICIIYNIICKYKIIVF